MRFVNQTFGERARQLGWKPKAGEDSETRLLRSSIVPLVAVWGGDQTLSAEARQLAERWLADKNSLDPDIVEPVLTVAARTGDRTLFDRLVAALPGTQDRHQRELIVDALGAFRDPEIARAGIQLVLRPELDIKEAPPLLFGPLSTPTTLALPFAFVEKNYEAIVARLPTGELFNFGTFLPFVGGEFCDQKSRHEVAAFFEPKVDRFAGSRRNLDQVLESIRLCEAFKTAQEASVAAFLRNY
jgi:alanyl aminopeptidase